MVLLDEGLSELAEQFKDLIDEGQWGTGTTTPAATDTSLESAVAATLKTVTTSSSSSSATFTHEITSADANGSDLTEFELRFTSNDSLFRVVGGAISKTSSINVKTITTVNFVRG